MTNLNIKSKSRGFTIVELLVVIVVVGILAAITVVSYSGIQDRARSVQAKTTAYSMRDAAEQFFAEKSYYPFTAAELQTFATLPSGVDFKGGPMATALTSTANTSGSVKIKYATCGTAAPAITGSTNTGYKIQYFDTAETTITGGTGTVCTTNSF